MRKIITYFTLIIAALIILSCTQSKHVKNNTENKKTDSLDAYFKAQGWNYPIEINITNKDSIFNIVDTSILAKLLREWIYKNNLLDQRYKAIRLSNFEILPDSHKKYIHFVCKSDLYRYGKKQNNILIPIEGHGMIANKFLAVFPTSHGLSLT